MGHRSVVGDVEETLPVVQSRRGEDRRCAGNPAFCGAGGAHCQWVGASDPLTRTSLVRHSARAREPPKWLEERVQ